MSPLWGPPRVGTSLLDAPLAPPSKFSCDRYGVSLSSAFVKGSPSRQVAPKNRIMSKLLRRHSKAMRGHQLIHERCVELEKLSRGYIVHAHGRFRSGCQRL